MPESGESSMNNKNSMNKVKINNESSSQPDNLNYSESTVPMGGGKSPSNGNFRQVSNHNTGEFISNKGN